ncbi:ATPase, predicted ATPase (AAA+ superfamily) [Bibersteinia trehalosi USDA-ARS-USMARC-188]|uniref:ATPase, predicted ATPase (AAA+ superfamily) n=2 Tax=Bibersteinia trehalosi TaxID=47735 RepID=A0A4V7IA54_BIBTR|nr:ATPase, predicted ATPase (AAA+ superfamily) [Bibersteinia trehalosi USDA-ARS-USMARC-192]AHG81849.1 ATPase, predicted ATPase (AAA+ superfamily) [Bibersteinia trehalosi USDA-ARS-USMARC-188]AHG84142.1 ATPase, predicted ATPase (AAA+ superfamily) [Bibersteinia trehalosi USDA-ARS-USMARC-189]
MQATLTINEEKTLEREFGNLLKIQDNYPKYVVKMDEFKGIFEGDFGVNFMGLFRLT